MGARVQEERRRHRKGGDVSLGKHELRVALGFVVAAALIITSWVHEGLSATMNVAGTIVAVWMVFSFIAWLSRSHLGAGMVTPSLDGRSLPCSSPKRNHPIIKHFPDIPVWLKGSLGPVPTDGVIQAVAELHADRRTAVVKEDRDELV
jgi:hypothetical protein